jgi:hypothetical protein
MVLVIWTFLTDLVEPVVVLKVVVVCEEEDMLLVGTRGRECLCRRWRHRIEGFG